MLGKIFILGFAAQMSAVSHVSSTTWYHNDLLQKFDLSPPYLGSAYAARLAARCSNLRWVRRLACLFLCLGRADRLGFVIEPSIPFFFAL